MITFSFIHESGSVYGEENITIINGDCDVDFNLWPYDADGAGIFRDMDMTYTMDEPLEFYWD